LFLNFWGLNLSKKTLVNLSIIVLLFLLLSSNAIADINQEVQEIQSTLQSEFYDILAAPNSQDKMIVVIGSQINGVEAVAIEIIKSKIQKPQLIPLITRKESEGTLNEVLTTSKTVFLVGGPSQNLVTRKFVNEGLVKISEAEKGKSLILSRGKNRNNAKIIVLSDSRGFNNVARDSARLSPLAKFMPLPLVPVAASIIGILLSYILRFWPYLLKFLKTYAGKYISSKGKKTAKVKEHYIGFKVAHHHVKLRECISILIASSAYAVAIALSYTGLQSEIVKTLKITLIAAFVIFGIKEIIRILMSFIAKIHAEFVFWLPGAIVACISGWLGNTMNTVSFILEFPDKHFSHEKMTKIKYAVTIMAFLAGAVFFVINLVHPAKLYQMIMATATTSSMAEMIPVKPLAGKDFKEWKKWLWITTTLVMAVLYVLMNFVI